MRSLIPVLKKFEEADVLLQDMIGASGDMARVQVYFSAFCSAARSVTFALQYAMSERPGFLEWYDSWRDRLGADPAARYFLGARNQGEKTGLSAVACGIGSGWGPGIPSPTSFYFGPIPGVPFPRDDVFSASHNHLTKLAELLNSCLGRFDPGDDQPGLSPSGHLRQVLAKYAPPHVEVEKGLKHE